MTGNRKAATRPNDARYALVPPPRSPRQNNEPWSPCRRLEDARRHRVSSRDKPGH